MEMAFQESAGDRLAGCGMLEKLKTPDRLETADTDRWNR